MKPNTAAPDAGDMRQALLVAASEVIIEKGLGAFSIREVARRAGVSHAAPGYHFGDMRGLLTSLATEGFDTLFEGLDSAVRVESSSVDRLLALGRGYVHVALKHPGHLAVMFRDDVVDGHDSQYEAAGMRAFSVLEQTVREFANDHNPQLDVGTASRFCWSAMQGLVTLHPKFLRIDQATAEPSIAIEALVQRFTELLISGLGAPTPC